MSTKQISEFTAAMIPLAGTELVPLSQGGNTVQTPLSSVPLTVLTGTLGVGHGGSGAATFTAHGVLLGEGASAFAVATIGTAGRLLIDQGTGADPAFTAMSGDGTISSAGVLAVTTLTGTAGVVAGPTGVDWVFNGVSGHDIIFKINNVEQARLSSGNSWTVSTGLKINSGALLIGSNRTQSLGGSNLNNYDPGKALNHRWTASGAINVTGMVQNTDGETRFIWNAGSNTITLTNQDAASTAANQWLTTTGANLALAANKCALAVYDSATAAWRVTLLP